MIGGARCVAASRSRLRRSASAPEAFGPYDGQIPFRCALQYVGTGTEFPDPDADPFCVEFDKTNQNVTDFGLVEFTAQEPARVAAASPKCFYFQRDHWTGSIVQGSEPELWHWDGDYFFDKARGVGGVSVRNFRVGGTPTDASPYVPEAYRPFFDEGGGGGALVELETDPDPTCAARVDTPAEQAQVYGDSAWRPPASLPAASCAAGGSAGRGSGCAGRRLLAQARAAGGVPAPDRPLVPDRQGRAAGRVLEARARRTLLSSGRGHSIRGVARGDRARRARRRLDLRRASASSATEPERSSVERAERAAGLGRDRARTRALGADLEPAGVSARRLTRTISDVR